MASPVRILGAGPAGLAAAISLAHAGLLVEVFEKRHDCGARFHGDLQGLENWSRTTDALDDLRRFHIEPAFEHHPFSTITQSNGRKSRTLHLERPAFYLLRRGVLAGSLDQALKQQALGAGVRIHFRRREPPESVDIVATGVDAKGVAAIAKGIVFTTDADDLAVGMFGDELAPFGYAYLLVAGGIGCLATVLFTRFARAASCFQAARAALLDRFPVRVAQESPFGGVGQFLLRPRFEEGGRLYVGEAAGLQDLLWGFGIRTAIESGTLAAESLIGGKDYRRLAEDRFLRRHRASIVNRFLWEACRWRNYSLVMAVLQRFHVRMLYTLYNECRPQKLLYPLAAWYVRRRIRRLGASV